MKRQLLLLIGIISNLYGFCQSTGYLHNLSNYIENINVLEEGQEKAHAYHIPKAHLLLNGKWKFTYSDTPWGIPDDFYKMSFDDSAWDTIKVPSNWEMEGFGDKFFRNVGTGFPLGRMGRRTSADSHKSTTLDDDYVPVKPGEVPYEWNPTGAYRTSFEMPLDWDGKEVFLRFEKVASASFVWVNGKQVGYNEGSHEPSEYNVTSYLQKGKNTIAILVTKFSDAYYLEGVDAWRLAGIFDDVTVFATPKQRIFDWQIITDLDDSFIDADLLLDVDVKGYDTAKEKFQIKATLTRNNQEIFSSASSLFVVSEDSIQTVSFKEFVTNPRKWTSETPDLYNLTIELFDQYGSMVDALDTRIGFKETQIVGNTFYLNGVPLKVNAINSHMQHPEMGHYVDEETIRRDLELLKQFNFNAVRTSHYPPTNKYIELADEYGLFIIDEVSDEAHQSPYLSGKSDFVEMYRDRTRKLVLRDRNHPCVLLWSAGNESGEGKNINEVVKLGKELDPTRYWMYGGNAPVHSAEDIIGPRYPTPIELEMHIGLNKEDNRPSFMDEYLAVTGNGGGELDEYWRVIYSHSRLMGGAIWDFVSTGVTEPIRRLDDLSEYKTPVHIMGNAKLVDGKNGKAIDLNGHDQWIEVYRAENTEISGDKLSLTLDVFPRNLARLGGYYITKGNNQFGINQKGKNELEFYLFNGERQVVTAPLPDDWEYHWHNITAVYNGTEMKLYIDGEVKVSKVTTGAIVNLPFPLNIGRNAEKHGDGTSEYICDALIDNVGVFTKEINPFSTIDKSDADLWLDFESESREGNFYSYGIGARTYGAIWPDRKPQPEMWQMKKTCQPLAFELIDKEKGVIQVWNHSHFLNASHWETTWTLTEDEKVLQSGKLDLNIRPQERGNITVPFKRPAVKAGKEYRLNISSCLKEDELWAPTGFEISWEQFEFKDWYQNNAVAKKSHHEVSLISDSTYFIVRGKDFSYNFDKKSGELVSLKINGDELLRSPLRLNVWRAPIANELDSWNSSSFKNSGWKSEYGDVIATEYYSNGLHNLKHYPLEVRATESNGNVYIYAREFVLLNGGTLEFAQLDKYIMGAKYNGFENIYEYRINGDGEINIEHSFLPQGTMPQFLPRVGLTLKLNNQFSQVEWYGRGPQENYPDRKTGYKVGIYSSTVEDMYEPYLIPQENGLRTDNRWLEIADEKGNGLKFSMDRYFNFSTSIYSTENLTKALYTYQLEKDSAVTVNLDYATTGVGGTARGILNAYRVYPTGYHREITISPLRK
ncbi:beta-galactosidase small subunit-related protein [Mangrovibacterium diazotrophicum]|uniref:Beta-galactosidase n=1 Tax=Mangrovibacterium diazotrophicum TaxID=1261403 RepID=A0A419W5X2_9BACT|nr:glycoside hydrolase family 2 TIM barrel-domain containing protein [Mangrovibacterium diazotrophicum]RKD90863.1 beta-galactosidase [Mangrovibacterium diazotrophicum]